MPRQNLNPPFAGKARAALRLAVAGSALSVLAVLGAHAQQSEALRSTLSGEGAAVPASEGGQADGVPADPQPPAARRGLRVQAADERTPGAAAAASRRAVPPRTDLGTGTDAGPDADPDAPANGRAARETVRADEAELRGRAEHALAIEALPRTDAVETDPFEAVGVRAGGFILRPSVETGITASSNAARTPSGSSGVLSETTLRLDARSDWSEHTATLDGFGTFRRSLSGEEVDDVEGGINAALRLDLGADWQARAGLAYSVRPESASAIDAVADAEEQPLRQDFQAEAGLDKALGKLRLGSTVSVERDRYGDAALLDGGTADQSERNSTLGLVRLRTGYAVSPALAPFVEAEVGRRVYDETGETDRSADRIGARVGVTLDFREKLSGEVALGWLRESFEDEDLDPIQGPSLLAALRWSPARDTVVALTAVTNVEGTPAAGESGSLVQDLRLAVERTLRANLTAQAGLGASLRDYAGTDGYDVTLVADVGTTWWLNRWAGLTGRLRHERLESNLQDRDYQENSIFFGTRLQY